MTLGVLSVADLDAVVGEIRRDFGDRFPAKGRDESNDETQVREERTRLVLEREVLPELAARRRDGRLPALSEVDERAVVEGVIAGLFTVPKLLGPLRRPNVVDIGVFGCAPVRVEELDGTITEEPPLVRRDRDLERIMRGLR